MAVNKDAFNALLASEGVAIAMPEPRSTVSVSPLHPLTNDAIANLGSNDPEVVRLMAELQARKEALAVPLYSNKMTITKFVNYSPTVETTEVVDVLGAAAYAEELISLRAQIRKSIEDGNKIMSFEDRKHLVVELEGIKSFLKGLGFSTQYGATGIYAINRVDLKQFA